MSDKTFSHFGLCVSDLDKALRFYCDGLGFTRGASFDVGNEFRGALEVEGEVAVKSVFISRDGHNIELLCFTLPGTQGEPSQSRNQLGLTHMSLHVENFEAAAQQLIERGGVRLESTTAEALNEDGSRLKLGFFADPDGNRIELMENAAAT